MKETLLILVLVFIAVTVIGQTTPTASSTTTTPTPFQTFISRLSLRQSFQGKLEREEAAFLSLVYPEAKKSSQVFSFALGYNVFHPDLSLIALRPFLEWQKNTAADKEQDVILSGFSLQWILWDVIAKSRSWVPIFFSNVNYKNDKIKATEGFQASLYFAPIFNGKGGKFYLLPDAETNTPALAFYYNFYTGLEYENRAKAKNSPEQGTITRWYNRVTANFYPLPNILDRRLEIIPDFIYRSALSNLSAAEKDHNKLFRSTFNLILLKKATSGIADVKIGYDYVNGVDPTKGYEEQKVKTFTLKVKI